MAYSLPEDEIEPWTLHERQTKKIKRTHDKELIPVQFTAMVSSASDADYKLLRLVESLLFETGKITSLPLRQIFRLQTVCKHWHQLIAELINPKLRCKELLPGVNQRCILPRTESSKENNQKEKEEERWFIMTSENEETDERWHSVVFSDRDGGLFYPPQIPSTIAKLGDVVARKDCYIQKMYRMKCLNGLMFALVHMLPQMGYCVIVLNCLTGHGKLLPTHKLTIEMRPKMRVAFDQQDVSRYYIMHSFSDYYNGGGRFNGAIVFDELLAYDSVKDSWKIVSDSIGSAVEDFSKLMQGDFFFYRKYRPYHMQLSYNVAEDAWSSVWVGKWKEVFEGEYNHEILVFEKFNGRLLTCVAIKEKDYKYTKFKVCELKSISISSAIWVEVSEFCFQEPYPSSFFLDAVAFAEGQVLCCYFRIAGYDNEKNEYPKRPAPILYDMALNRWHSLPYSAWPRSFGSDCGSDCSMILRPWQAMKQLMPCHNK